MTVRPNSNRVGDDRRHLRGIKTRWSVSKRRALIPVGVPPQRATGGALLTVGEVR